MNSLHVRKLVSLLAWLVFHVLCNTNISVVVVVELSSLTYLLLAAAAAAVAPYNFSFWLLFAIWFWSLCPKNLTTRTGFEWEIQAHLCAGISFYRASLLPLYFVVFVYKCTERWPQILYISTKNNHQNAWGDWACVYLYLCMCRTVNRFTCLCFIFVGFASVHYSLQLEYFRWVSMPFFRNKCSCSISSLLAPHPALAPAPDPALAAKSNKIRSASPKMRFYREDH